MHLTPLIKPLSETVCVGIHLTLSLSTNRTGELWSTFMPRRRELTETVSTELISLQVYPEGYFESFNPTTPFEKWALAEVGSLNNIPEGMEPFVIPAGLYAVFEYKGMPGDSRIFSYIFQVWLPQSGYRLDSRPHFEVLGARYKNGDPNSEEEIWVPVREV